MTVPDVSARRIPASKHKPKPITVNLGAVTFADSGGNGYVDRGETVRLTLPLRNYVTNPLNARRLEGLQGELSTTTPGVTVTQSKSPYFKIDPGQTVANTKDYALTLAPSFVNGTDIELRLDVTGPGDSMTLLYTLFTGTPVPTVLLSEDFDPGAPPALPAGWTAVHGAGAPTIPWTTSNTFCATSSNAAFHTDTVGTRWERLISPSFVVPAAAQYVTVDFDVCYDSEEEPAFNVLAYDGFFLRVTDLTSGRTLRSVLAEAFEDKFTTGTMEHYPRHFPRSSSSSYFADMSAWAGSSGGFQHVHMRLPGMAGSTAQLRFEYTQDATGTCVDVGRPGPCGVMLDNVVVSSVTAAP
jgi:hypothetical protein